MKKRIKVIFDTNVWISFLIGKRLSIVKEYIIVQKILIITSEQIINEIKKVTSKEKLKKYFPEQSVIELIILLESISIHYDDISKNLVCRDAKDNFLLDLIETSGADFLVTGDKDLLILNPFKNTSIITPLVFEQILKDI